MFNPPIGVANSISANFQFDPIDTLDFARQGNFDIVQIYLPDVFLNEDDKLNSLAKRLGDLKDVYFHAEGFLNEEFQNSDYRKKLYRFLSRFDSPKYIIHFDERANIDKLIRLVESLSQETPKIYVENYFLTPGKIAAEKNLKKYQALFTLSTNFGHTIYPVFDIPRIFHQQLEFTEEEELEWCYQLLNFFGNRNIPLLLHLIDAKTADQSRHEFTAVGKGYIPYKKLFRFMQKTRPNISGIILEFEDKINPLQSRDFIRSILEET